MGNKNNKQIIRKVWGNLNNKWITEKTKSSMERSSLSNMKSKLFPGKFSSPLMSAGDPYCLLGSVLSIAPYRQRSPCLGICPQNCTVQTRPLFLIRSLSLELHCSGKLPSLVPCIVLAPHRIGAVATSLCHNHSNARSELHLGAHRNDGSLAHWARPGIKSAFSWLLVRFISAEPWWELPLFLLLIENTFLLYI